MDEFSLIDALLADEPALPAWVVTGPGDDGAVVESPAGTQWVLSTDTLVEGRHFPAGVAADVLGWRALAVNLSDLAAMGADPAGVLVALVAESLTERWCRDFAAGLRAAAGESGARLVGGNLARGPLSVTVTATGSVPNGGALLRNGAAAGQQLCVSGVLGAARLGMERLRAEGLDPGDFDIARMPDWLRPYLLPDARVDLGRHLRGRATACIDISDGLLADLGHLCAASGLAAEVQLAALPVAGDDRLAAATAGDDYELLFTLPADADPADIAAVCGVPVCRIGTLHAGRGIRLLDAAGNAVNVEGAAGWSHFR